MIQKLDENKPARSIRRKLNEIIDELAKLRIASAPGMRVKRTATGTVLEVNRTVGGAGGGTIIKKFVSLSYQGSHLSGVPGNLQDEPSEEPAGQIVAVPRALRPDASLPAGPSIGDVEIIGADGELRTLSLVLDANITVILTQSIQPTYAGGVIYAARDPVGGTYGGTSNPPAWIDLNVDARRWETDWRKVEVCVNNTTRYALAGISQNT